MARKPVGGIMRKGQEQINERKETGRKCVSREGRERRREGREREREGAGRK